ncbi:MAG TPA: VOC family protein [Pyrinomonadaceae bacterium]|nr:VOC family protein [Pyrinomonadaceae bacterium]
MKVVLDHLVLNVVDIAASVNFYRTVLDFKIERLDEFEKGRVGVPSARVNEETVIDLFPPKMWKKDDSELQNSKINLNHFCFNLKENDWKRLVDRLRINNVEIVRYADNNWGAKGIGVSIYFCDPDGNEIEARYYPN